MPLYDYKCPEGHRFTRLLPLERYDEMQVCECGHPAQKQLAAPRVVADYAGYECPVSGQWIEGRAAHRENLARHGCRILEPGESREASRRRAAADEKLENDFADTAERLVHEMPAAKREKLTAELEGGMDVSITRL